MKKIAFLIVSHGEDGRGKESIVDAYWDETRRDIAINGMKNKSYFDIKDIIVDVDKSYNEAVAKLTKLDRLVISTVENKEEL